jgi:hypothetical protein
MKEKIIQANVTYLYNLQGIFSYHIINLNTPNNERRKQ